MMPVALDMGETEQVDERQILLHCESGLGGEIFSRHEITRAAIHIQCPASRRVEQRAIEALAVLARYTGIAMGDGLHKGIESVVGFVDQRLRHVGQSSHIGLQGIGAGKRLLDIQRRCGEPL